MPGKSHKVKEDFSENTLFTVADPQISVLIFHANDYFCAMLSKENEAFMAFWIRNRDKEKTSFRPFFIGLSSGFGIGIGVIVLLESGWYTRANMVANSMLSSVVLLVGILLTSFFMAFFYRKFRWEMQEQRYLELLAAKKRAENQDAKQP